MRGARREYSNTCIPSDNSGLEPDLQQDSLCAGTERAWGEILERACSLSQADGEGGGRGAPGGAGGRNREDPGPGRNGKLDLM